jgi:RND family efflux transporter MFP subunit
LRPVRTLQVFASGGTRQRSFSGIARSAAESRLSFKVPGTIREIPVEVGDSVEVGQLLAALDTEDYLLQVREAEAGLAREQAQLRNADASYQRVRLLYENNNASRSDLDGARALFESAEAAVRVAQQRLQSARLQLGYTRLSAATRGAVAAVYAEENENVLTGQQVLMLTSGSSLEVEVAVPEVLITLITEGDSASVVFDAVPGREFAATVTEVGVAAVGAGTTFPVTALLKETDGSVRSGMAATITFTFVSPGRRELFLVPSVAVAEDRDGRFVFVVEPTEEGSTGLVRRRPVEVGELTSQGLEVTEGLQDGDLLVIAGVSRIRDGLEVRLELD